VAAFAGASLLTLIALGTVAGQVLLGQSDHHRDTLTVG